MTSSSTTNSLFAGFEKVSVVVFFWNAFNEIVGLRMSCLLNVSGQISKFPFSFKVSSNDRTKKKMQSSAPENHASVVWQFWETIFSPNCVKSNALFST